MHMRASTSLHPSSFRQTWRPLSTAVPATPKSSADISAHLTPVCLFLGGRGSRADCFSIAALALRPAGIVSQEAVNGKHSKMNAKSKGEASTPAVALPYACGPSTPNGPVEPHAPNLRWDLCSGMLRPLETGANFQPAHSDVQQAFLGWNVLFCVSCSTTHRRVADNPS